MAPKNDHIGIIISARCYALQVAFYCAIGLFTSAVGGFCFVFTVMSVCLYVSLQSDTKSYGRIFKKLVEYIDHGSKQSRVNFS